MNAGKFPTAMEAKKDVGGSFYVVRGILQELVHESKVPPVDKKEDPREKIAIEKDEISTNTREISKPDQLPQPSILVENDELKDDGIESPNPTNKPTSRLHLDSETDPSAHEDEQQFFNSPSKTGSTESKIVSERELPEVPSVDVEHKTSVWQNLKSFANGIFSIWKRS
ncbi:hydroxyproline-rich glycoprotein family protein [Striga hermonthica]|uniref:Hydroxyproline-rich glycoprotein family protein n=1 Tax=Striga hermonthica TaxID=68872 RepID=A0A9N7P175_STRHE|nr:hydroxyproline-rich glycoprotein family protein [Striga hermonthica]